MADSQCADISKIVPQVGELFSPYVINCVVMSFLSITAIAGNVLILVSICRAPQFVRQPSYFLLVNLAFADFCVGFLAEPVYLVYKISYLLNPFSALSCYAGIAFNFLSYFLTSLSLWTAAAISLDRLLALHLHMKYTTIVTKFRVCCLIAVLLTLSSVFASMFKWELDAQNTVFVCVDSLALLIALLSYVRIFQIVRYHHRQISTQLSEVSFGQRGDSDSTAGSSFHGQQNGREQFLRNREEPVDTQMSGKQEKGREMQGKGRDRENFSATNELMQNKITTDCPENAILEERFLVSDNLVTSQPSIDEQMEIMRTKDEKQRKKRQAGLGPRTVEDTTGQLVETTNRKSQITCLSGGGSTTFEDSLKLFNSLTEKAEATATEEESQSEPTDINLELTLTEIDLPRVEHNKQNKSFTELQQEKFAFENNQTESGSYYRETFPLNLNLSYAVADEKATDEQVKTLNEEMSINQKICFKRLHPSCHQNHNLINENSAHVLNERQETRQEQTEVTLKDEINCVKRCYQNDELKRVLIEQKALAVRSETFRKEQKEAYLVRGDSLNQIHNSNHASGDETAPTRIKQINSNEKTNTPEIQKCAATLGKESNCEATSRNQRLNSSKSRSSTFVSNAAITENQTTNKSSRKGFKMRHFKKSVFNMFVIWFLMLLCYLPLICISSLVMFQGRSYPIHLAFNFTTSVMFVNSSINPIVFCWRIREFRAAVRKTLSEVFGFWESQNHRHDNLSSVMS